uniref:Uncharacterized protein n=1 Tax=Ditylenchus dipsaci TaxID=166011 RepID=A0A915DT33_9BILA
MLFFAILQSSSAMVIKRRSLSSLPSQQRTVSNAYMDNLLVVESPEFLKQEDKQATYDFPEGVFQFSGAAMEKRSSQHQLPPIDDVAVLDAMRDLCERLRRKRLMNTLEKRANTEDMISFLCSSNKFW